MIGQMRNRGGFKRTIGGWRARLRVAILTIVLAAVAGSAGASLHATALHATALDVSFEDVFILVGGYQVFATIPEADGGPAATVVATLRTKSGDRLATAHAVTDDFGTVEIDFMTHGHAMLLPISIHAGHFIELRVDSHAMLIDVQPISATPDIDADTITGSAPPSTTVQVNASIPGGGFANATTEAGPDGSWAAMLGDSIDLVEGATGAAFYEDRGVYYQADWSARHVRGALGDSTVSVRTWAGDQVRAVLTDYETGRFLAHGDAVAWSGGSESTEVTLRRSDGDLYPVIAGSRLELEFSDGTRWEEDVPPISIEIDAEANRVVVVTDAGTIVRAVVEGDTVEATAGDDGAAVLDFVPSGIDLTSATPVDVLIPGTALASARAYVPGVDEIDPLVVAVEGRGVAGVPIRLAAKGGHSIPIGEHTGHVGVDGRFVLVARDAESEPVAFGSPDIETIILDLSNSSSPGSLMLEFPNSPLLASARASRDQVEGIAEAGETLWVEAGGERLEAITGEDGQWMVDFTDIVDLQPGLPVSVTRGEADGMPQRLTFPVYRVTAQLNSGRIRIEGHPGLDAQIELSRDGDAIAFGNCIVERSTCESILETADDEAVRIRAEDTVTVFPDEGSTASLDIVALTAHIDLSGFDVTGAAPPDETVSIIFQNDQGISTPLDTTINADGTGVYDYELTSGQHELLVPGLSAEVTYDLYDGNRVMAIGVVEVLRVDYASSPSGQSARELVNGVAEPGSRVELRVRPVGALSGAAVHTSSAVAGPDGTVQLPLWAPGDPTRTLVPGDRVELVHSRGMITLDVPPLGAWVASPGGAVAGVLPSLPGSSVRALHRLHPVPQSLIPPERDLADVLSTDGIISRNGSFRLEPPQLAADDLKWLETVFYLAPSAEMRLILGRPLPGNLGPTVHLPSVVSP